jgi:hypothetical protein
MRGAVLLAILAGLTSGTVQGSPVMPAATGQVNAVTAPAGQAASGFAAGAPQTPQIGTVDSLLSSAPEVFMPGAYEGFVALGVVNSAMIRTVVGYLRTNAPSPEEIREDRLLSQRQGQGPPPARKPIVPVPEPAPWNPLANVSAGTLFNVGFALIAIVVLALKVR